MTPAPDSDLPLELLVLAMLRERVPKHRWDARRVIWAVRDYRALIDVWMISTRFADWAAGADRLADPHPHLRRYLEDEQKRVQPGVASIRRLQAYDRSDVVAAPAREAHR